MSHTCKEKVSYPQLQFYFKSTGLVASPSVSFLSRPAAPPHSITHTFAAGSMWSTLTSFLFLMVCWTPTLMIFDQLLVKKKKDMLYHFSSKRALIKTFNQGEGPLTVKEEVEEVCLSALGCGCVGWYECLAKERCWAVETIRFEKRVRKPSQ